MPVQVPIYDVFRCRLLIVRLLELFYAFIVNFLLRLVLICRHCARHCRPGIWFRCSCYSLFNIIFIWQLASVNFHASAFFLDFLPAVRGVKNGDDRERASTPSAQKKKKRRKRNNKIIIISKLPSTCYAMANAQCSINNDNNNNR